MGLVNMERLTEKKIGNSYPLKDKAAAKVGLFTDYDGFYAYFEAVNRLGEIEDILGDDYNLDRLNELVKADEEKRCLILPCRVDDTVYHITTCKDFPEVLDGTLYDDDGGFGTATGLYCPCELNENCPFPINEDGSFDCEKHKNTYAVFEDEVNEIFISDEGYFAHLSYSGFVDFENFGKKIFLTQEEAQQALKEGDERDRQNI